MRTHIMYYNVAVKRLFIALLIKNWYCLRDLIETIMYSHFW